MTHLLNTYTWHVRDAAQRSEQDVKKVCLRNVNSVAQKIKIK